MSEFGTTPKSPPWIHSSTQAIATGVPQQQMQTQIVGQMTMGTFKGTTMSQYQQLQPFQPPTIMPQAGMARTMTGATTNTGVGVPAAAQLYPQVATVSYPTPRSLNPIAFQTSNSAPQKPSTMTNTGIGISAATQMYQVATVSYPTPRSLNPIAFQTLPNTAGLQKPLVASTTRGPTPKQRVFTGTVTKVHDNFGFVDEDVFFQSSCCAKGSNPIVGDRALVEASYNPNMPFKWNATRIQVLHIPETSFSRAPSDNLNKSFSSAEQNTYNANSYNTVPPPMDNLGNIFVGRTNQRKGPGLRDKSRDRIRNTNENEWKKRREERPREQEEKDKQSPVRHLGKNPHQPARHRPRTIARYMVHMPKITLAASQADVLELQRRYSNMYIPSDFFSTNFRWVDAFPPDNPFTLDHPCSFHVMDKEVDAIIENTSVLEPPDADYLFSAKVMLISMPGMDEIFHKCPLAEEIDNRESDNSHDLIHPTRMINFLVGIRGKNEAMAIGGAWSPSLDGASPEKDPSVLINTAVRTCRALTGIDLSCCTQWYRFLEIYYMRGETTHKGRVVPARVETVVLFVPDVWSCVPTRLEWDGLHFNYNKQFEDKMKVAEAVHVNTREGEECTEEIGNERTNSSELDPKGLDVNELRHELEARTLSSKGLKSQLVARLAKALKMECEQDGIREEKKNEEQEPLTIAKKEENGNQKKKEDEESKKQEECGKKYKLPASPHILVHPSRTAKSSKFECSVMSLSLILDYRQADTKEYSFEVSLFAEIFNEMLMRDFGFRIYQALNNAPYRAKKVQDKKDDIDVKGKRNGKPEKKNNDKMSDVRDKTDDEEGEELEENSKDDKMGNSREDADSKKTHKMYTHDRHLLLSFLYFDQSHCGYIHDKDIEELLFSLGLDLSRAQVKKLLQKVVVRDSLHYRKLTDKPRVKDEDAVVKGEEKMKDIDQVACEQLAVLALGNKRELPVFTAGSSTLPTLKRARTESQTDPIDVQEVPHGYVMYNGSLLNVDKLMTQLSRSEKARIDAEAKMVQLGEDVCLAREKGVSSENTIQNLSSRIEDYEEKLTNLTSEKVKILANCEKYIKAIHTINNVVVPLTCDNLITETEETLITD